MMEQPPLHWRRSKSTGNLFLRDINDGRAGLVFKRPKDGAFSFKMRGQEIASLPYPTEEAAVEALYAALGM